MLDTRKDRRKRFIAPKRAHKHNVSSVRAWRVLVADKTRAFAKFQSRYFPTEKKKLFYRYFVIFV